MNFDLIAFDGDDTLWENEALYRRVRDRFQALLEPYGAFADLPERVDRIEIANLKYYGYGAMSFILSLVEAAIELTGGAVRSEDIRRILELGKEMLAAPVTLLEGAREAVTTLARRCPLMMITKGDLRHQLAKLEGSGLSPCFKHVEVVSTKNAQVYRSILEKYGLAPGRFLMVGNSLPSDILPVIELGAWAVYVPNALTWSHEQVEADCLAGEKCFEIQRLSQLPGLLESLQADSSST